MWVWMWVYARGWAKEGYEYGCVCVWGRGEVVNYAEGQGVRKGVGARWEEWNAQGNGLCRGREG